MTLCPVAIAVGCKKCPVFAICPAKSIIGDHEPEKSKSGNRKKQAKERQKRKPKP